MATSSYLGRITLLVVNVRFSEKTVSELVPPRVDLSFHDELKYSNDMTCSTRIVLVVDTQSYLRDSDRGTDGSPVSDVHVRCPS